MAERTKSELLRLPPFKGRISTRYNRPIFIASLAEFPRNLRGALCRVLINSRNRVVSLPLPLTEKERKEIVVKEFRCLGLQKLKSPFLPSKAFRAWQGAWSLVESELDTPFPVAYLERRKMGILSQSFFLSEYIPDALEIRHFFRQLRPAELRYLLAGLSDVLRTCHEKGILHRDLSDGNILVQRRDWGLFRFFFIDTNRIRKKKILSLRQKIKNLVRLGVPREMQELFLEHYFGYENLKRSHVSRYRFYKKRYSLWVGLKKALGLKKLARWLRLQ